MQDETAIQFGQALVDGDLRSLNADQRVAYYQSVCRSVGLNPLTRPLEYIELNGKLTLYAKRDATDQLRHKHEVSIEILDRNIHEEVYIVRARATMPSGRTDEALGAVSLVGLEGDALANALMKAETKAKRRVALSICGLGLLDETELETIPGLHDPTTPRAAGATRAARPKAIFEAWEATGAPSRQPLYDYVQTTFGKRVTALTPTEVEQVLTWVAQSAILPQPAEVACVD
jgi:hypothetical protein